MKITQGPTTKKEYQANIPKCCQWQTYEEHMDYMAFCWGITCGLVTGESDCGRECPEHKEHDPALLHAILHDFELRREGE